MAEPFDFDLDPVSSITVDAVGAPGHRTFYLQATQGRRVHTFLIEKEHAAALAVSIERLLDTVQESRRAGGQPELEPLDVDMDLVQPVEVAFRVGQLGIGIDEEREAVVLVAEELSEEDESGQRARFVGTYPQMLTLSRQALAVVNRGRPTCALCGEPIDPEGHFCARRNGHPPPQV